MNSRTTLDETIANLESHLMDKNKVVAHVSIETIMDAVEWLKKMKPMIELSEKETPMYPIKDKKRTRFGMGYEYNDWMCPRCESFLAFEPAYERIPNRCPHCNQKLIRLTRKEAESM